MTEAGLYIHVPFCAKKCGYCDFFSGKYSREASDAFAEAAARNIRRYAGEGLAAPTVYFGGGTPSLLSGEQLRLVLNEARRSFFVPPEAEITLEANPSTLSPKKLEELREIGVNRLSIGTQSMLADELALLGRASSPERNRKAVLDAAGAGFGNISCDLMIALPGQTAEKLLRSIDELASLPITHVSAYILGIEEGTPFAEKGVADILPSEEETAELYLAMVKALEERGFAQYEVSNFARKGFESRHNLRYWKLLDYIGIGPSAHSCFRGKRFFVPRDLQAFINAPEQPVVVEDEEAGSPEELAMLRLRLKEGLLLSDVPTLRENIEKKLPRLAREGYAESDGETVSLTAKGFLVSNSIIADLVF